VALLWCLKCSIQWIVLSAGVNAVIRSLAFEKGDGILLYRWTYGAVKNACTYISDTRRK